MKRKIVLSALAFFAFGALSIQNAEAQEPVKNKVQKQEVTIEKKTTKPVTDKQDVKKAEMATQKMVEKKNVEDCCAPKAAAKADKKDSCCSEKQDKDHRKKLDGAGRKGKDVRRSDKVKKEKPAVEK